MTLPEFLICWALVIITPGILFAIVSHTIGFKRTEDDDVMTDKQLEAIRKRAKKAQGNWLTNFNAMHNASHLVYEDVPELLAEIERLKAK